MSTENATDMPPTDAEQEADETTQDQPADAEHEADADVTSDDAPSSDEPDAVKAANKQAAGYRRKLRASEQQNEALTARVARYEAAEFAELASAAGAASHDDLALVTDLDAFRGADGALNRERLSEHIAQVKRDRPHWFDRPRRPSPRDVGAGRAGLPWPAKDGKKRWGDVIRPR